MYLWWVVWYRNENRFCQNSIISKRVHTNRMESSTLAAPFQASGRMLDDAVMPTVADILSTVNTTSEMETTCLMQSQSNPSQVCSFPIISICSELLNSVYISLSLCIAVYLGKKIHYRLKRNKKNKESTTAWVRKKRGGIH